VKRASGGLALALLLMAGAARGEAYGLKAARAALSGKSQAVIVALPKGFVRADASLGGRAAVAFDWSFYFTGWLKARGARSNVVVVTPAELNSLIRGAAFKAECTTLWVRDRSHGLLYDADCAPKAEVYAAGDQWLTSGEAPAGFRPVVLKPR
jgi:hypothetical protein